MAPRIAGKLSKEATAWNTWLRDPRNNPLPPPKKIKRGSGNHMRVAPYLNAWPGRLSRIISLAEHMESTPYFDPQLGIAGTKLTNAGEKTSGLTIVLGIEGTPVKPFFTATKYEWSLYRDLFFTGLISEPPPPFETPELTPKIEILRFGSLSLSTTEAGQEYLGSGQLESMQLIHAQLLFPYTKTFPSPFVQTGDRYSTDPLKVLYPTLPWINQIRQQKIIGLRYVIDTSQETHLLKVYGRGQGGDLILLTVLEPFCEPNKFPHFKRVTLGKWLRDSCSRPDFFRAAAAISHKRRRNYPHGYSTQFGSEHTANLPPSAPCHPYKGKKVILAGPGEDTNSYQVYGANAKKTGKMDAFIQTVTCPEEGKPAVISRSAQYPAGTLERKPRQIRARGKAGGQLKKDTMTWLKWVRVKDPTHQMTPPTTLVKVNTNGRANVAPRITVDLGTILKTSLLPPFVESRPDYDPARGTVGVLLTWPGEEKPFLKVVLRRIQDSTTSPIRPYALKPEHEWAFDRDLFLAGLLRKITRYSWTNVRPPAEIIELEYFTGDLPIAEPRQVYLSPAHLEGIPILWPKFYSPGTISFPSPLLQAGERWRVDPTGILYPSLRIGPHLQEHLIFDLRYRFIPQAKPLLVRILTAGAPKWEYLLAAFEPSVREGQFSTFTPVTLENWLAGKCQKPNFYTLREELPNGEPLPENTPFIQHRDRKLAAIGPTQEGLGYEVYGRDPETKRMDLLVET